MRYKSPRVRAAYNLFILALIITLIVIGIVGVLTTQDVNAESAPVDTQHWQLMTDGDAWLITPPECNLQVTEFGGSYYFSCVADKGEQ